MSAYLPGVPEPRPYQTGGDASIPAAEYRAIWERLRALGYDDGAYYERVMLALNELDECRKDNVA